MKGIASQQRKVAAPAQMPIAQVQAQQARQQVQAASVQSVAEADAGALQTELNGVIDRINAYGIP